MQPGSRLFCDDPGLPVLNSLSKAVRELLPEGAHALA